MFRNESVFNHLYVILMSGVNSLCESTLNVTKNALDLNAFL